MFTQIIFSSTLEDYCLCYIFKFIKYLQPAKEILHFIIPHNTILKSYSIVQDLYRYTIQYILQLLLWTKEIKKIELDLYIINCNYVRLFNTDILYSLKCRQYCSSASDVKLKFIVNHTNIHILKSFWINIPQYNEMYKRQYVQFI